MGRRPAKRKPASSKKKKNSSGLPNAKVKSDRCWVDELRFEPLRPGSNGGEPDPTSISVLSWNVLAEAYCSRYSHVQLPAQYEKVVFRPSKRKALLLQVLGELCRENHPDVVCLQEVDLSEIGVLLDSLGYVGVETPRVVGGGAGGRTDACAVYVRTTDTTSLPSTDTTTPSTSSLIDGDEDDDEDNQEGDDIETNSQPQWQLVDHEILRLDDLATLSSAGAVTSDSSSAVSSNVQGMQMSLLRRNVAVLVRLRNIHTQQTIVLANAHLYWNPGFEYVKLCQAHYILLRVRSFQTAPDECVVFCGDLNSRPGGTTHQYLTKGYINAKRIAPWYTMLANRDEEEAVVDDKVHEAATSDPANGNSLISHFNALNVFDGDERKSSSNELPRVRYLLDAGLNKLCRWLRILGQDAALETEEEEKIRTGKGEMIIFERCVKERRTLVTTSPRLMQRRDCPSSVYCIHPPFLSKLEVALVHMFLTHGVVLEPSTFLSRCVVCNGNIVEEHNDEEKRRILKEYEAPPDLIDGGMAVYECDGCKQGYWWNELPTSSASRVKTAATRLFELCVRGGVPVREGDDESGLFSHVNITELQKLGWDHEIPGSELLHQRLDVVEWLKQERLECPFKLESAYALKLGQNGTPSVSLPIVGERIPFTNVTHQFVDTLDYIFFDKQFLAPTELLYVPTSFAELCGDRTHLENAHLLPSDVWPSDHLSIGARLVFRRPGDDVDVVGSSHRVMPAIDTTVSTSLQQATHSETNPAASDEGDAAYPYCVPIGIEGFSPPPVLPVPPVQPTVPHKSRCGCGCVPSIPSLFEMAEKRKQAKLEKRRLA